MQRVSSEGYKLWGPSGRHVNEGGSFPYVLANGDSGVFVAWEGNDNVRVQKLNLSGMALWPAGGILASTDTRGGSGPALALDGIGGVMVTWSGIDPNGMGIDVPRVQRFDANGVRLWGETALTLSVRYFHNGYYDQTIVSDGTQGGAIACWHENTGKLFVNDTGKTFAQRIDASGHVLWQRNGVALSDSITGQRWRIFAVSDSAGGAFVTWYCQGYSLLQHIDNNGSRHLGNNGICLCQGSSEYNLFADGRGGVFVLTFCIAAGNNLQHVDKLNRLLLGNTPSGVRLSDPNTLGPACLDQGGGVFFTTDVYQGGMNGWNDKLLAGHVDSTGKALGPGNGSEVCKTLTSDSPLDMATTAPGEAMVAWMDNRDILIDEYSQIYIAKITDNGVVSVPALAAAQWPRSLSLHGPYPNPALASSLLEVTISKRSAVRVTLSDLTGRELGLLFEGEQTPGEFYVPIDTSPLAPGSYFIVAKAGEETRTARLIVAGR